MSSIDLVPFGFTPTENLAYSALLKLGPSTGYVVAREIGVARANTYQALAGLVAKGTATKAQGSPARFRAIQPPAVLTLLVERETTKLDELERQVQKRSPDGEPALIPVGGRRAVQELVNRTLVREPSPVRLVAEAGLLASVTPAWRKRASDGLPANIWVTGDGSGLALSPNGTVVLDDLNRIFPAIEGLLILESDGLALVAWEQGDGMGGYWTSEPVLVGLIRAAADSITGRT